MESVAPDPIPEVLTCGIGRYLVFSRSERRDANAGDAGMAHAQHIGCARRNIDDAAAHEGPAIVDRDRGRAAIIEIGDNHLGAEGQRPMRGRQVADMTAAGGASLAGIVGRRA